MIYNRSEVQVKQTTYISMVETAWGLLPVTTLAFPHPLSVLSLVFL